MKVIGVGNEACGDDAVGCIVASGIRERNLPGVRVEILTGDGVSFLEAWKGESRVVVIDCASSGAAPGTIHLFPADAVRVPIHLYSGSTHVFGLMEAIELSRVLGELPARLDVYAIEGCHFEPGSPVCDEVLQAADAVIQEIVAELLSCADRHLIRPGGFAF